MNTLTSISLLPFAAAALLTLSTGCTMDDADDTGEVQDTEDETDDTGTVVVETAMLRALHLSPDAPAVDIFVGDPDTPAVTGLSFPDGTDYLEVPVGTYDIWVSVAGAPSSEAVLEVTGLALAADTSYSAVAIDNVAELSAVALVDDASGLDSANVRFQVSHTAPGVGAVDIWAVLPDGAVKLLDDVGFGVTATLDDLPASAYTLAFDVDEDGMGDVLFSVPELPGGTFANVFAANDTDGKVFLVAHLPDGTTARIDATLP